MAYGCGILVVILVVLFGLGKCQQSKDAAALDDMMVQMEREAKSFESPTLPATTAGSPFVVVSDLKASYRLLKWSRMDNGNIESLTRRDGPSGTSFARREIDCENRTFRYLGEGDTEAEASNDRPVIGGMSDFLLDGSIADVTVRFVCSKAKK